MNTKILILFSLFVLGIAEECREDTATSCVDNLLTALLGPESEICGELRKVNDCLKSAVETCLGDDRGTDVDEGLKQLDDLLHQNCPVLGLAEECMEGRAASCLNNVLGALLGSQDQLCDELRNVRQCINSAVEECLGNDHEAEIDTSLQQLENLWHENCPEETSNEQCLKNNKEYLMGCKEIAVQKLRKLMVEGTSVPSNKEAMKCDAYRSIGQCAVDRAREKCGEDASSVLLEELNNPPQGISDACKAAVYRNRATDSDVSSSDKK